MILYLGIFYRLKLAFVLGYDLRAYCSLRFDPLTFAAEVLHSPQELFRVFLLFKLKEPFLQVFFFFLFLPDRDETLFVAGS